MSILETQTQSIISLFAWGNYTYINYSTGRRELLSKTLKRFEEVLAENRQFIRINRSYLINTAYIKHLGENYVELNDNKILEAV